MSKIINPSEKTQIEFNPEKYKLLVRALKLAKRKNVKDFYFDGVLLLTEYAEYLVEYLKPIYEND